MVLESNTLDVLFVKDGQQGEDGKILYTWIKYAKDANGTGITDDPNGAIYIGISYNNESSIESNDPTQYAWTKIQGADGKKGEDAYTIFLENENISFATDENRNPLSEQAYTSGITIMKGAKPVTDFTIGDIAKTQGIAVAKTDTAIAISVVNGNPLPYDSGEIEIPITVGGTVFKKILTWTCAKKGDQGDKGDTGEKGQDGTSIKITSKSVTYQTSTSGTTAPTGTWSTTVPTVNNGQYLWTKTTVQYSDGNKTEAYSVSYKGTNGTNGTSVTVSKTEVTYQVSTSGTTAPTGTWSTTMPSCDQGQYLWTKTYVKYSDGEDTTSYSVSYKGVDGEKFAFNMLRETNQGSKHWVNIGASGKYSVESITTEDSINAVKLICTEPIASNEWQFCDFSDYEMVKSLKASTTYTLSYDIKANRSGKILHNIKTGGGQKMFFANDIGCKVLGNETWEHVSLKMTSGTTLPNLDGQVIYMFGDALSKVGYSIIKNLKLTEGTVDTPWAPHPKDLEGRGVSQTVQYYLATSQASGVTSSTSGWSTDITTQKLTADKKYLWNCYQTKYSDGTSEPISTPKVIGVYGDKGANALQCKRNWTGTYTTINGTTSAALSDFNRTPVAGDVFTTLDGSSNTGTWQVISVNGSNVNIKLLSYVNSRGEKGDNAKNLTITPSAQYFKSTDGGKTFAPNTITIKPTIQGEISFGKWQYSIDGGVSFADAVSGQKGLTISNNVLTVSKDSSLYSDAVTMVTFRAVASNSSFYDTCSIAKIYDVSDIEIGGRNLAKKGCIALWDNSATFNDDTFSEDGSVVFSRKSAAVNSGVIIDRYVNYEKDEHYIVSFKMRVTSGTVNSFYLWNGKGHTNNSIYVDGIKSGTLHADVSFPTDDQYHQITAYFTATGTTSTEASDIDINHHLILQPIKGTAATYTVQLLNFKIEKGNKATDWTPAPEDVQTAILSTKSEISDVSLKVDKNKQAIEQRVEKTTYEQDLTLVKGDISKANEGLNKWRYEIYPKSLFTSEYQGKSTMDVFAKNTNLTPSQSVLINDTDFGKNWAYGDNYIGYALTFVKFSAAKSVAITFKHDDGAHLYLNGKLIGGDDTYNTGSGESLTLSFIQGWNCLEVVLNEKSGGEYIGLGTTISAISECQLMNCYYGTPVARQSHITNQLVQNTTDIDGVSGSVQKVMSTVGGSGKIDEFVSNYATWKKKVDGIETRVGETYTTKDDFDDLQIGGRNLLKHSSMIGEKLICDNYFICNNCNIQEYTNDGFHIITPTEGNANNGIAFAFDNFTIMEINGGDTITFSCDIKGTSDSHAPFVSIHISDNNWYGSGVVQKNTNVSITKDWQRVSVTITTPTGLTKNHMWLAIHGNHQSDLYVRNFKLEKGNKPTDWTPAPEDVNGKIVNVETIANQTAKEFSWIVKGGDSSSNFTLTDRVADLVAERINFKGLVTFSGLNTDAKNEIGKVAQSKVDGLEVGGRNLLVQKNITEGYLSTDGKGSFVGSGGGDQTSDWIDVSGNKYITVTLYEDFTNTNNSGRYCEYDADKNCISTIDYNPRQKSSVIIELKSNTKYIRVTAIECKTRRYKIEAGNKATDWTPAPEDVSQDATNKASQALTDAKNYSSNAVNWVTNNGSSTTSLNSMVKKWTDGAVSDTTQINGGWIKANTITASKIALADFTNYSQLTRDTAATYGFAVTDDTDGTWFSTQGIRRDQFISETFPCNGGESYLIEYDISTNAKGANNSTDTKNYIGVAIGVYGYTGTVGSNGLPNKATNIWYATRVTGSEAAAVTHVKTTITTSTATKQFRIFLQSNGYYFEGTTKIRNLSVRRIYGGTLIVDGSITADKIATDAIKSRNYISSGGTQGSFLNLNDGSFTSPNLSWDSNGNLIAKNANLSGEITATEGTIGRYDITETYLKTGSGSTCSGFGSDYAFWAGNDEAKYAPFRVEYDGTLNIEHITVHGNQEDVYMKIGKDFLTIQDVNTSAHIGLDGFDFDFANSRIKTGDQGIELYGGTPYIDFHYDNSYADYTSRIIAQKNRDCLSFTGSIELGADLYAYGWIYNAPGGHYTWNNRNDAYISCGNYNNTNNIYYYAGYHAFYVNGDSGSGMMYIETSGVSSRKGFRNSSDERIKQNFSHFDDNFIDTYMSLEPVQYQFKNDTNDKYHFGFKAQQTERILNAYGQESDKSYGICATHAINPEKAEKLYGVKDMHEEYTLAYDELIAPTTYMVQHTYKELESTKNELEQVKQEKADLEARLQIIEAKLGL